MVHVMIAHEPDLQVLFCGNTALKGNRRGKFYEGYYCLQVAEQADLTIRYDKESTRAQGTVAWVSHPGPYIEFAPSKAHGTWHHRYISFNGPRADNWWRCGLLQGGAQSLPAEKRWGKRFDEVLRWHAPVSPLSSRGLAAALELFLVELAGERQATRPAAPWLVRAQRMLSDTRSFHPDITAVAEACGMPVSTFRRHFVAELGCSPQQWAITQRLQRACTLLQDPDRTVAAIADHLGYATPFQLSQQFKKHMGISPTAWRAGLD